MVEEIASLATATAVISVLCSSHSAARPKSEPDAKAVEKAHAAIVKSEPDRRPALKLSCEITRS